MVLATDQMYNNSFTIDCTNQCVLTCTLLKAVSWEHGWLLSWLSNQFKDKTRFDSLYQVICSIELWVWILGLMQLLSLLYSKLKCNHLTFVFFCDLLNGWSIEVHIRTSLKQYLILEHYARKTTMHYTACVTVLIINLSYSTVH